MITDQSETSSLTKHHRSTKVFCAVFIWNKFLQTRQTTLEKVVKKYNYGNKLNANKMQQIPKFVLGKLSQQKEFLIIITCLATSVFYPQILSGQKNRKRVKIMENRVKRKKEITITKKQCFSE